MPDAKEAKRAEREMLKAMQAVLKLRPPHEKIPTMSKLESAIKDFKDAAQDYFRAVWDV